MPILGLESAIQAITHMKREAQHPSAQTVSRVTAHMISAVQTNFNEGGRPKWKPRKRSYPHPPLMKTKRLYRSIGEIRRANGGEIEIGTAVEYAGYQHDGTKRIDARPFFTWTDRDIEMIRDILIESFDL